MAARRQRSPLFKRSFSNMDRSALDVTLDQAVRFSLVEYVTLFRSRGDVLYPIFFILGCGYHRWLNANTGGTILEIFGC